MDSDLNIIKVLQPEERDFFEIRSKLQEYNRSFFEISEKPRYIFKILDKSKQLHGGLVCTQVGQWLEIDLLWIDQNLRGKGFGFKLMDSAEKLAKDLKCLHLSTTTFNFQAKPFYLKMGYHVVYVQKNYPITNEKYFLEKEL